MMPQKKQDPPPGNLTATLKSVSRTIYFSFKVLPPDVRLPMSLGYLICRALDTAVDSSSAGRAEKKRFLDLVSAIGPGFDPAPAAEAAAAFLPGVKHKGERELLGSMDFVFKEALRLGGPDLADLREAVTGVASGMEMDLAAFAGGSPAAPSALSDDDALLRYCDLIGGKPGLFWAGLYQRRLRETLPEASGLPSARDGGMIGSALQVTNILKDAAADLAIGRCYFPSADLAAAGLAPADLRDPASMRKFRPTVNKWISWAVDQLDICETFVAAIPKSELGMRAAVIWPVYWAMDTLLEVAKANVLDPRARPRISKRRVYTTIAATPPLLLSNTAFTRGYRFRRETLIVAISGTEAPI
ncbi:MAG: squalene/phytoene synthase family protein [Elusimicrobia bacterium]|nr:MAG: squalene/phytoene synthase family protein [Elusimicrobiota bacterium]KAF0154845.1 MAG: squalene/phytoene synthase family protein [Elusimicrobiota bacterium]